MVIGKPKLCDGQGCYNRPISLGIDYFVNNLNDRKGAKFDVEAGGFLKRKERSKLKKMGNRFDGVNRTTQSVMRGCSGF